MKPTFTRRTMLQARGNAGGHSGSLITVSPALARTERQPRSSVRVQEAIRDTGRPCGEAFPRNDVAGIYRRRGHAEKAWSYEGAFGKAKRRKRTPPMDGSTTVFLAAVD